MTARSLLNMPKEKLNLGCGYDKREGFINTDKFPQTNPDLILDVDCKFPFEDNKFEYVLCSHILEHTKDLIFTMGEIYRVLEDGGIVEIAIPEFPCRASIIDPTHIRYFALETFLMFCNPAWYKGSNFIGAGMFDVIDVERIRWIYPGEAEETAGNYFTEIKYKLKKVNKDYWLNKENQEINIKEKICRRS